MVFSIIVPVYNTEKYLSKCIESIISQTFSDFELILVNDGSTDSSGNICDDYAKQDSRIKVLHSENKGVTHARKLGVNQAKGDFVLLIDSDDTFVNNFLEEIKKDIELYPSVEVFIYNMNYVYSTKTVTSELSVLPGLYENKSMEIVRQNIVYDTNKPWPNFGSITYSVCAKAVRKSLFISCQNEVDDQTSIGEDMLVTVKLIKRASSIFVSEFAGYNYFINSGSVTHTFNVGQLPKIENAIKLLYQEVEDKNKAYVFALTNLLLQLSSCGSKSTHKEFKKYMKLIKKEHQLMWSFAKKAKIKKARFVQKIHLLLFRLHFYSFLYYYYHKQANKNSN